MYKIPESEIHKDFQQREVRDLLSNLLRKTQQEIDTLQLERQSGLTGLSHVIFSQEQLASYHQQKAELLKKSSTILRTVQLMGWEDWDVSDETAKSSEFVYWKSFIGTEKEYNQFLQSLKT